MLTWNRLCSLAGLTAALSVPAAAQTHLWSEQLGSTQNEHAYGLALDGSGGVFVGGTTNGALAAPASVIDLWIARYDGAGALQWVKQLGNPGINALMSTAGDGAGLAYTTGYTEGGLVGTSAGSLDAWVIVFDSAGNAVWFEQFGSATVDVPLAITADGTGGAFVCGYTDGDLGGPHVDEYDAWVAHVDAGGVSWIRHLGALGMDKANGVAVDGAGGVYVGGETWSDLGGPNLGLSDGWLARFDGAGNLLWSRQIGTSGFDINLALASDDNGGVFAGGITTGNLGGTPAGAYDVWVARYDAGGTQSWVEQFGGAKNEYVGGLTGDGSGGVYVGGKTSVADFGEFDDTDGLLARLDATGALLWSIAPGSPDKDDAIWRLVSPGPGQLFLAGDTTGDLGGPQQGMGDAWIARYDGDCSSGSGYCSASTTSIAGCSASLRGIGTPSAGHPGVFTLSTSPIPGGNLGLCLFGASGPASTPFGTLGGFLCVKSPLFRTAPSSTGGSAGQCNGALDFSLAELAAISGVVVSGATLHAQVWARDPANQDGFMLSDGWTFDVCP
jgi:hypothetical protein